MLGCMPIWLSSYRELRVCRELIRQHAVNNTVVVTWANYHYRDFALNWAEHLEAAGAPSGRRQSSLCVRSWTCS